MMMVARRWTTDRGPWLGSGPCCHAACLPFTTEEECLLTRDADMLTLQLYPDRVQVHSPLLCPPPREIFPYLVVVIGLENVLVLTKSVVSTPVDLEVKLRIAQGEECVCVCVRALSNLQPRVSLLQASVMRAGLS